LRLSFRGSAGRLSRPGSFEGEPDSHRALANRRGDPLAVSLPLRISPCSLGDAGRTSSDQLVHCWDMAPG